MNRYKIWKVNGLGNKVEITTVVADSFTDMWNGRLHFFNHEKGIFGGLTKVLVGTYQDKHEANLLVEKVG